MIGPNTEPESSSGKNTLRNTRFSIILSQPTKGAAASAEVEGYTHAEAVRVLKDCAKRGRYAVAVQTDTGVRMMAGGTCLTVDGRWVWELRMLCIKK